MKKQSRILYRDSRYGFTLSIPRWWSSYIVVRRDKGELNSEYGVHFRFKYKGKLYEDVMTVVVLPLTYKQWVEQGYEDSPLVFIAEHCGKVFAYYTPEELPDAFIDPKTQEYDFKKYAIPIKLLKRMVNEDAPRIARSIRFRAPVRTFRSVPLRSKKVWPCRCKRRK
ncbi:hypothetical protein N0M98_24365 [Paenibacillus doosanensis]|uniref:Uncharacterized protein n=1 Tax=Paenibacillus konkukensis TaxID=2020716 RepID=A0ABY4RU04_9BACL|nr:MULTISPECIES: hypothetical protein [Paenibacillus]MCS7463262.1 hypothetical protein [Paenibacillus doosanensis]UQZ85204.1 hypothetical protein SK3146_04487 [Paenibacillus konkukensis]